MFQLTRHPHSRCDAVDRIEADIRTDGRCAHLRYRVIGRIAGLRLPGAADQPDSDRLWEDTCFEMFARTAGALDYDELNLSPSGKWVHFNFTDYRSGRDRWRTITPDILTEATSDSFTLSGVGALPERGPWRIGLSAVIEETNGRKSYWALAHPPGDPDFHHPDCFVLDLPPPA
jgi:hypothetical protein